MTKYPPLSNPAAFAKAVPERITYHKGHPRNYRFNAKTGVLRFEDEHDITSSGAAFSLIPLAFRIFKASLFGGEEKDWFEVYFLNQSGHVCVLSFHSSSVDRLKRAIVRNLMYDGLTLAECIMTVRPLPRNHEKYGPYYVADFFFEELPQPAADKGTEIRRLLPPIYREDTVSHPDTISLMAGYGHPGILNHAPAAIDSREAA